MVKLVSKRSNFLSMLYLTKTSQTFDLRRTQLSYPHAKPRAREIECSFGQYSARDGLDRPLGINGVAVGMLLFLPDEDESAMILL